MFSLISDKINVRMCQSAIQWIVFCGMFHIFVQINRNFTVIPDEVRIYRHPRRGQDLPSSPTRSGFTVIPDLIGDLKIG